MRARPAQSQARSSWPRSKATSTTSARTSSASCSAATTTRSSTWASWCRPTGSCRPPSTKRADLIGLSGLITPSLDEMVFVAREMERRGFTIPLLIGGATTSRQHTSVKIAPEFSQPVVHVLDASRAVDVVSSLLSHAQKPDFDAANRAEQARIRQQHAALKQRPLLSWPAAQANRLRASTGRTRNRSRVRRLPARGCWTTSSSRTWCRTSTGRSSSRRGS